MKATEPGRVRFTGFSPQAFRLLAGLRRHNDRAWFAPRKERMIAELTRPALALVADASDALARAKIGIRADGQRSVFRLYRDVRFARDKAPYRTNVAAYLSYDGGRDTPGGIYIHVEPGDVHLTVAFYRLPSPMLVRWRRDMAERPARFRRVVAALARKGLSVSEPQTRDDSLVRMPRGFEGAARSDLAPYFRLRSFCVQRTLDEKTASSPALVGAIVAIARDALPFLRYGWAFD